jgi:hypothetical protein
MQKFLTQSFIFTRKDQIDITNSGAQITGTIAFTVSVDMINVSNGINNTKLNGSTNLSGQSLQRKLAIICFRLSPYTNVMTKLPH